MGTAYKGRSWYIHDYPALYCLSSQLSVLLSTSPRTMFTTTTILTLALAASQVTAQCSFPSLPSLICLADNMPLYSYKPRRPSHRPNLPIQTIHSRRHRLRHHLHYHRHIPLLVHDTPQVLVVLVPACWCYWQWCWIGFACCLRVEQS